MKKKLIMYSYWILARVFGPIILFCWTIPMLPLSFIAFSILQESVSDGLVTTFNAVALMANISLVPRKPKELWDFVMSYDYDKLFKF